MFVQRRGGINIITAVSSQYLEVDSNEVFLHFSITQVDFTYL